MIRNRTLFHIIRILVGAVFILSALLKLLSVDIFELYIYSQGIFSFNISALLARLVISTEFAIGALLIAGIYYRQVFTATWILLGAFSVFLLIKLFGRQAEENCNCFGDYLKMTPAQSLLKNIALLFFLFLIRKQPGVQIKNASTLLICIGIAALVCPSIYSVPDFIKTWETQTINLEQSGDLIRTNETLNEFSISEGKRLVCFFSVTCQYCELASKKISLIAEDHSLQEHIFYVFAGNESELSAFWEISGSEKYPYTFLEMRPFFKIAGPIVPSIFLLENGVVIKQYHYRNINEGEIVRFFEGK